MIYWGKNDITVIKGQELFGTIPTIDDSSHFLVTTAMLKKKKKKKKKIFFFFFLISNLEVY